MKIKPTPLYIFCFLLLVSNNLHSANEYNLQFSQISTKDGLSQNTVRTILKDEKGFIWAGTLDGLNRYDGHRIITYKPEIGNKNSLIDHRIKRLFQDQHGYLWIETYKNEFSCYDPVSNTFINYTPDQVAGEVPKYLNCHEASNGDIWLWGGNSACLLVKKEGKHLFSTPILKEELSGNRNNCRFLFEDSRNNIWIGGNKGLFRVTNGTAKLFIGDTLQLKGALECKGKLYFSSDSSILEYSSEEQCFNTIRLNMTVSNIAKLDDENLLIADKTSGISLLNTKTQSLFKPDWAKDTKLRGEIEFIKDRKKGIWIYNSTGIVWYYHRKKKDVRQMELIPPETARIIDLERYNIFIDSKDIIWITTYGNGLFCYNPETEQLENYKHDINKNSPASDYLLDITEDQYGNIWIGSNYAGIIKVTRPDYKLKIIRPEEEISIGKSNNIRSIYYDSSHHFWIGTKNGRLYLYDENLSEKKLIRKGINPYAIMEDDRNRVWIGTKGQGLHIINKDTYETIEHCISAKANHALSHNTIFTILKDNKGRIWLGTFGGGISLVNEDDGKITFKHFFASSGNRSYVRHLYQDSKGLVWAATSEGILRFNPDELQKDPHAFTAYKMDISDKNGINCNDIKTIFEDKEKTIWIGTAGGGISQYKPQTAGAKEHFVPYTTKNGLTGDIVSGIMEDGSNNLWISTENGIVKFKKKNETFITYKFSDKTYSNHFNENANTTDAKGNMLWGSLDGLVAFNPQSFKPDTNTLPVTFTNLLIYNQIVNAGQEDSPLKQTISYSENIKLSYEQNTFTIEFASLNLKDPLKNKYTYKLENYDKKWSPPNQTNSATYKNLPYGKYLFKVRGTNSDGVWNKDFTQLHITIAPPVWLSWYAYSLYAILTIIILYFIIRIIYKLHQLQNNIQLEKKLTEHKIRFFTNISHEFRTPLTLIRNVVEKLNALNETSPQMKKQLSVLNRNSSALTRLIDELLEFRKLENKALKLEIEAIDIVEFSKEILANFLEIAQQKEIKYIFSCNKKHFQCFLDRNKFDKILQNILSNAFKFTSKKGTIELSLHFKPDTRTCLIQIKDDGIGIPEEKQDLLFSRFMQINFSSTGTGVGLSLVKELVDVHKGKVWYENNKPQGSIFNIELPTDAESYKGEHFLDASSPKREPTHKLSDSITDSFEETKHPGLPDELNHKFKDFKVLVIEDNDDIRDFLHSEFSKHFDIELAENGKAGLEKAMETNPYLIVCDVMMPEMDGFEVTKHLKSNFDTCHIPIILLTAHSSIEHQIEGIESGADAYIMKPFSIKFLSAKIFQLLEQREQLKKRFSNEYILDGSLISTNQDQIFFGLVNDILDNHMSDSELTVDKFSKLVGQKRSVFYKKIKGLTGVSPNELIRIKRLKRAAELLIEGDMTVSEVAYKVGFEDPFYFSKCFKTRYKCSPSKYRNDKK